MPASVLPKNQRSTYVVSTATRRRGRTREAFYPALFEELGFAYTGSDAYVLTVTLDKWLTKLVLGQRGGLRKIENTLAQESAAWQVLCLRLATIKCHARGDVSADVLSLRRSGNEAVLEFPPEWAQTHPRTLYLLREEAEAWSRGGTLKLTLRG